MWILRGAFPCLNGRICVVDGSIPYRCGSRLERMRSFEKCDMVVLYRGRSGPELSLGDECWLFVLDMVSW